MGKNLSTPKFGARIPRRKTLNLKNVYICDWMEIADWQNNTNAMKKAVAQWKYCLLLFLHTFVVRFLVFRILGRLGFDDQIVLFQSEIFERLAALEDG